MKSSLCLVVALTRRPYSRHPLPATALGEGTTSRAFTAQARPGCERQGSPRGTETRRSVPLVAVEVVPSPMVFMGEGGSCKLPGEGNTEAQRRLHLCASVSFRRRSSAPASASPIAERNHTGRSASRATNTPCSTSANTRGPTSARAELSYSTAWSAPAIASARFARLILYLRRMSSTGTSWPPEPARSATRWQVSRERRG